MSSPFPHTFSSFRVYEPREKKGKNLLCVANEIIHREVRKLLENYITESFRFSEGICTSTLLVQEYYTFSTRVYFKRAKI